MNKFQTKLALAGNISAVAIACALPVSTTATDILFGLAVLFNLAAGNLKQKFTFILQNRIVVLLLAFFALCVIGMFYGNTPPKDAWFMLGKYDKFLFAALLCPLFAEERWRKLALQVFFYTMLGILALSYIKTGYYLYTDTSLSDFIVFKKHIAYSIFMAFFAYLIILKIFKNPHKRWLWGTILALAIIDIFFISDGRTGYFIFVCLAGLSLLQKMHWKWRGWLFAFLSIVALLGLALAFSHTFDNRIRAVVSDVHAYQNQNENTSFGARLAFVKNTLPIIKSHPVIGGGTGSFQSEYANLKPRPTSFTRNPHNEYINIMSQFGVIGLLFLLFIFYSQLRLSRYLPNQLGWIAQAVVITIMIGSLVNSLLMDSTEGHFYVYFIALTFAALPQERWWKKGYFI